MPIYSPVGYLDITNATLRTSNLEAQNFRLNGGNIYVTSELTTNELLNLDNVVSAGNAASDTVQFTNSTTGFIVDSNIVVAGNVTAAFLHGDASNVTAVPAAQITGTLAVANGGTGTTTSTGTGSVVLSDAPTFTGDVTFDTNTLFVDSVNDRVGVGTSTPEATLHVVGNAYVSSNLEVGTANLFVDTVNSRVGIGTASPDETLSIYKEDTTAAGQTKISSITGVFSGSDAIGGGNINNTGLYINLDSSATGGTVTNTEEHRVWGIDVDIDVTGDSDDIRGGRFLVRSALAANGSDQTSVIYGIDAQGQHNGSGPATNLFGVSARSFKGSNSTGLTDRMIGVDAECEINAGTCTDAYGVRSRLDRNGGAVTNSYLFYGEHLGSTTTITNNYGLYVTGADKHYLEGDVGIGTTSPDNALHIRNAIPAVLLDDSDDNTKVRFAGGSGGDLYVDSNWGGSGNTGDIIFREASSEKMRITGSGNVGIGTTNPQGQLHISSGTSGDCVMILQADTDNNFEGDNPRIEFWQDGSQNLAAIAMTDNELNIMNSVSAGGIVFHTGTTSGYTNAVERMRIDPSGNVGIGTSSPVGVNGGQRIEGSSTTGFEYIATRDSNLADGDFIGAYIFKNADTGGTEPHYAGMTAYAAGANGQMDLRFFGGRETYETSPTVPHMTLDQNGRLGIGTTSPTVNLHLYGGQDLLYLQKSTNTGGVGMKFTDSTAVNQHGYLRYYHADSASFGTGNCFRFSTDQTSETLALGGALHIGVDGKDAGDGGSHRKNLFIQSTYGGNTSQGYGWWMGAQDETLTASDNDFFFSVVRNGTIKQCAAIADQNNSTINFTGQHRTFVKDTPTNQLDDKDGLIVIADQNEFIKMSGGVAYGNEAITINESLPVVSFSNKAKDKRCFGVLSTTEDPETRKEVHGNFTSLMQKEEGDTRVYVNSVGEGAIWVTDTNGTLESGDYITTSNVAGYGMKQDDDILHNYTVAKILMDCDFNPPTQVKRVIKKESRMIDYWIRYGDVKITEEEYQTLPETKRKIVEDVHYRIDQMEVVKEDPEKDTFVYEQREEMVNVLDEHGEFQWEDHPTETEKAYKLRYLDADGNIVDEANAVHIAAFVGCTYHCG